MRMKKKKREKKEKKKLLSQDVTLEENFASGPHILKEHKVTGK